MSNTVTHLIYSHHHADHAGASSRVEKYTGVLAAADVFTASTTFWVMQSIRRDVGYRSYVHP